MLFFFNNNQFSASVLDGINKPGEQAYHADSIPSAD